MKCKGKKRSNRLPIGGFSLTCSPSTNPQFSFILLDRVLVYNREIENYGKRPRVNLIDFSKVEPVTDYK
jgi:hypothetical protein